MANLRYAGFLALAGGTLIVGCGTVSHKSLPKVSKSVRTTGIRVPAGPQAPSAISLMSIAMTSRLAGWGALSPSPNSPYFVVHTVDGGSTWRSAGPKPAVESTPDFFNAETALEIVPDGTDRIALAYTENTGYSWSKATGTLHWPSNEYRNLEPLQTDFLTKRQGFVFASTYVNQSTHSNKAWIYHTSDRGKTWTKIATPAGQKLGIAFATPMMGWIVVAHTNGNGSATTTNLVETTDAGRRWERASLPRPSGLSSLFTLQMVGIPRIFRSSHVAVVPCTWVDTATGRAVTVWSRWSARRGWKSYASGLQTNATSAFAWLPHNMGGDVAWSWSTPQDGSFISGGHLYQTTTGGLSWNPKGAVPAGVFALDLISPAKGWALATTNALFGVSVSAVTPGGGWQAMLPKLR